MAASHTLPDSKFHSSLHSQSATAQLVNTKKDNPKTMENVVIHGLQFGAKDITIENKNTGKKVTYRNVNELLEDLMRKKELRRAPIQELVVPFEIFKDLFKVIPKTSWKLHLNTVICNERTDLLQFFLENDIGFSFCLHEAVGRNKERSLEWLLKNLPKPMLQNEFDRRSDPRLCKQVCSVKAPSGKMYYARVFFRTFFESSSIKMADLMADCINERRINLEDKESKENNSFWEIDRTILLLVDPAFKIAILREHNEKIFSIIVTKLPNAVEHFISNQVEVDVGISFFGPITRPILGLEFIASYGTHKMLMDLMNKMNPFMLFEQFQKQNQDNKIIWALRQSTHLSDEQKVQILKTIDQIILVVSGNINQNPESYIQFISDRIQMDAKGTKEQDKWLRVLEKSVSELKGHNPKTDKIKDQIYAMIGKIYLSQYDENLPTSGHWVDKANEAWMKIINFENVMNPDNIEWMMKSFMLDFDKHSSVKKKKVMEFLLAAARSGDIDAYSWLSRIIGYRSDQLFETFQNPGTLTSLVMTSNSLDFL